MNDYPPDYGYGPEPAFVDCDNCEGVGYIEVNGEEMECPCCLGRGEVINEDLSLQDQYFITRAREIGARLP